MTETQLMIDMIFDLLKDVNTKTNLYIVDEGHRMEIDKHLKQISMLVNIIHFNQMKKSDS